MGAGGKNELIKLFRLWNPLGRGEGLVARFGVMCH